MSEAQDALNELAASLDRWAARLSAIADGMPAAAFEPDTDAPLNVEAGIQSLVASMLRDELPALARIVRAAAALSEDSMG
ncbi:MAG: hypothetical protein D6696_15655 [Acidobacteria bacterium]|nr:MAG: hypothetical protein D6696_15655 [Acidobacteriota bacterium]